MTKAIQSARGGAGCGPQTLVLQKRWPHPLARCAAAWTLRTNGTQCWSSLRVKVRSELSDTSHKHSRTSTPPLQAGFFVESLVGF